MDAPSVRHPLPLAVLLGVVVRAPFWAEALRTPVDGDTAILGLMARHLGRGTTMWGQPYGSPLEAWLAAPVFALMGARPGQSVSYAGPRRTFHVEVVGVRPAL